MPLFNPPAFLTGSALSPAPDGTNRMFTPDGTFEEASIIVSHNGRQLIRAPLSFRASGEFPDRLEKGISYLLRIARDV